MNKFRALCLGLFVALGFGESPPYTFADSDIDTANWGGAGATQFDLVYGIDKDDNNKTVRVG